VIDPRTSVIEKHLSGIKKTIVVTGWKGGIGKSVTSCVGALLLAEMGKKVGLLDLDFAGASCHLILGAKEVFPKEEKGIIPPEVNGVRFVSISFFSGENAVPLRGSEVSNAIIELLAIVQWGNLDYLIVDMPPGISDTALDVLRLFTRAQVLALTTPSPVARDVLSRALRLYKSLKIPVIGIVENMADRKKKEVKFSIGFDKNIEQALASPGKLLKTRFASDLKKIVKCL